MIDWLNQIYPDHPVSENMEGNIYLLRQMDGNEEIKKWLKQNFDPIFQHELNDWNTNEDNWPKNRTFKLFQEWFEFEVFSMIFDLEESKITKEDSAMAPY